LFAAQFICEHETTCFSQYCLIQDLRCSVWILNATWVRPPCCLVFGYGMKVSVPTSQVIRFGNPGSKRLGSFSRNLVVHVNSRGGVVKARNVVTLRCGSTRSTTGNVRSHACIFCKCCSGRTFSSR
jgi:hypothetical protein